MLHLLGPQRRDPNLVQVLDALDVSGPLVAFTAGWRHDEDELGALEDAVGPIDHLPLYRWFDALGSDAAEIAQLYRERQSRIKRFKQLYRLRMAAGLKTVRALVRLEVVTKTSSNSRSRAHPRWSVGSTAKHSPKSIA